MPAREKPDNKPPQELPADALARLFESLEMLFSSGLPLGEGFELLRAAADSPDEQRLLSALGAAVQNGQRLSEAFEQTGGLTRYALSLLKVAEQTGQLAETCQALADYYQKRDRLSAAVRSALIYPLAMLAMVFVVVVMVLTQAMPILDQVFAQFGFAMSGLAQVLLSAGSWLRGAAFGLSLATVLLAAVLLVLRRLSIGRRFFAWLYQHSPLTASLSFRIALQRLMLGLATMLKSGMTPQAALDQAVGLVDDQRVLRHLNELRMNIEQGAGFQQALADSGLVPADGRLLVAVGFRTGANAEAFERISEDLGDAAERQLTALVSIIEPTLVAVMAVLVGTILMSVLLPLLGVLASF